MNIGFTFLEEVRPWTMTQADIEGYEDIHIEPQDAAENANAEFNRKVSLWIGQETKLNVDTFVTIDPTMGEEFDSSDPKHVLIRTRQSLKDCLPIISSNEFKTVAFEYFKEDSDTLVRTVREWLDEGCVPSVIRFIFCVSEDEDQQLMEEIMIKHFPPCYDNDFYVAYWDTEKKFMEEVTNKRAREGGMDANVLLDLQQEWQFRLDEAMRISKDEY